MTSSTEARPDGRYVLVVEDDDDLRETMQLLLSGRRFRVATAANGAEALRLLRAGRAQPCLILLDLMMPVMDGFELLRQMKADPALSAVPVVVLTGAGPLADRRSAEIKAEVLRKPVGRDKILATVDRFCPRGEPNAPIG